MIERQPEAVGTPRVKPLPTVEADEKYGGSIRQGRSPRKKVEGRLDNPPYRPFAWPLDVRGRGSNGLIADRALPPHKIICKAGPAGQDCAMTAGTKHLEQAIPVRLNWEHAACRAIGHPSTGFAHLSMRRV